MKTIRYICKNAKYPSLADKITKICRERGAVIIQTENKPYFKFDDCTESTVFFDNSTDNELLKRLFTDIFGEINGTDEDGSSYNAYHYTYGNPDAVFSHLFMEKEKKMIIGIESADGDKLISGKALAFDEINSAVRELLQTLDEKSFTAAFCSRYGYKELPYYEGAYAAYVIDLDTHTVIVPGYSFPKQLNGAKVLYYTEKGDFAPVQNPAQNVCYLAVCKYDDNSDYFIFHLDECFEVVADDCYDSFEACRKAMRDIRFFEMKNEK